MIKAINLHKFYDELHVLKGVNLEIKKSEVISIVGASGTGKTTLLQILGTLDYFSSTEEKSSLIIDGQDIDSLNQQQIATFRNKNLGFVFQFHQLLPEFSALENICIPAYIGNTPKTVAEKKAKELLSFLNLSNRINHKPNELSGGEQQRVAVARALINDPSIILADEPSGNLDTESASLIQQLIFDMSSTYGIALIAATHDNKFTDSFNKVYILSNSKLNKANE